MSKKVNTALAIAVIIIIAGVVGVAIWWNGNQKIILQQQIVQPVPVQGTQNIKSNNNSTQGVIYTNSDYGFQLTIPKNYSDYNVIVEPNFGGNGITYIYFVFKTSDAQFSNLTIPENRVTHEKYPGYAEGLAITAWIKNAYEKASIECKEGPSPACPRKISGENKDYVFQLDPALDPPQDLRPLLDLIKMNPEEALSFKGI